MAVFPWGWGRIPFGVILQKGEQYKHRRKRKKDSISKLSSSERGWTSDKARVGGKVQACGGRGRKKERERKKKGEREKNTYYSSSTSFGKWSVQSSSRRQIGRPSKIDIDLSAPNNSQNVRRLISHSIGSRPSYDVSSCICSVTAMCAASPKEAWEVASCPSQKWYTVSLKKCRWLSLFDKNQQCGSILSQIVPSQISW